MKPDWNGKRWNSWGAEENEEEDAVRIDNEMGEISHAV